MLQALIEPDAATRTPARPHSRAAAAAPARRGDGLQPSGKSRSFVLRTERVRDVEGLVAYAEAWSALAREAAAGAPTVGPAWLTSAMRHLAGRPGAVSVTFVWRDRWCGPRRDGTQLIGVFAHVATRALRGLALRAAEDWQHLYSFLGTPLLHREHAPEAVGAYLEALDGQDMAASLFRLLPSEGPVWQAFAAALKQSGRRHAVLARTSRAAYRIDGSVEDYLRANLVRKRRKEFKRLRARLEEEGAVTVERFGSGDDLGSWRSGFYALERAGWKGRAGTAIDCRWNWRAFFDDALAQLAAEGDLLFWRMSLDGRPIAMTFGVACGNEAWLCKIAYEEDFARFSPGALIIFDVMEDLVREGRVAVIDSCAIPDHPMINHIWRDAIALHDVMISARGRPGWTFAAALWRERVRRSLRARAKRLYHTLRSLSKGGGR